MDIANERLYPTPYANSAILSLLLLSLTSQKHAPKTTKTIHTEYDYIIVGAGTAGSVVASRLSELPCVNVLLLEAGKDPPLLTEVPALSTFFRRTDIDWNYKTIPQKHTGESLLNNEIPLVRGKTLGGSSVLKSIIAVRGSREDYNRWVSKGAHGWSYDDVMPYFYKLEDNKDQEYIKNGYHTVGGLQTIQRPKYQPETKRPIFQAARNIGFKVVDPNALKQTGFYDFQSTLRNGQRCSTAKSYLVPAENRTNLHILSNAMVTQIIIEDGGATGVKYDFQGETYEIRARKEVIMSAGAINNAQLLMLSGIGPKEELEKFEIPVMADIPVGKNLQDHCAVPLNFEMNSSIPGVLQKLMNPANVELYTKNKTGVLASPDFITALGFVNSDDNKSRKDVPSYQLHISEETSIFPELYYGLKPEIYSQVYGKYEKKPYFTCFSQTLHPRSRGTVKLRSKNPYDPPLIDPNYLDHPEDINDIVEGLKTCKKLAANPAMRRLNAKEFQSFYPACKEYIKKEGLYLWCLAKQVVISMNNPIGTTKMGNPGDPTTVVDAELRVKYIRSLRVIGASVMPSITSGDTSLSTIMIAEKASDIIKSSIDCQDFVAESEVQESIPMISLSSGYFPPRLQKPAQRRMHTDSSLNQLKHILGLHEINKRNYKRTSSQKIESQIVELVKAIQEATLNRRQEDPSSAAVREAVKCLEVLKQRISQSDQVGSLPGVRYLDGGSSETLANQLVLVLNDLRLNSNSQTNGRNTLSYNRVASALANLITSLEGLNEDREVAETTSSSSLTTSSNDASTANAVNQLMSALNNMRNEEQSQIAPSNLNKGNNRNSENSQLSQILSSIRGNIQGNDGQDQSTLLNQLLSAARGSRINGQGNDASDQNALLNQILSVARGNSQGGNEETDQNNLLNQILSATRGSTQGNNGNNQGSLLNQIISNVRESGQGRETSDQGALLSQILSSAGGTGQENMRNNQNDLINQILSTVRGNGQGNNGNDQNTPLNQILSASRSIDQRNNGNNQNNLLNQILSGTRGNGEGNIGNDQNSLLNQILSSARGTGEDDSANNNNSLLSQILFAVRETRQGSTSNDQNTLMNQLLSSTGNVQDNIGNDQNPLINQILSTARETGQGNTANGQNALLNQILSSSNGNGQDNNGNNQNDLLNQILSATRANGQENGRNDQNNLLNQILSSAQRNVQGSGGNDQNTLLNQIVSAAQRNGQGNGGNDQSAFLNQILTATRGNEQRNNGSDTNTLLNQILSATNAVRQRSSGNDQNNVLNQPTSGTGQGNNGRDQNSLQNQIMSTVQEATQNVQSPQINSNRNSTQSDTTETVQDLMNRIMSSINDIKQIEEESRALQNRNNATQENVDATQNMMNQILSAIHELRNSSSRQAQDESTTTPSNPENPQETILKQILSALNEIKENDQQSKQNQQMTNSTTEKENNPSNPTDSALSQILSAINEMREGMQTSRQSNSINPGNTLPAGETVPSQDLNINGGLQQILNQQGVPPIFQTIIRQEVGSSNPQTNRQNPYFAATNGIPVGPPGAPFMPPGMPFAPPGGQSFVPPGAPFLPPGMPPNPMLNLFQRQRNIQIFTALNGGGVNPQVPLPPQMMGMPQRVPVPVPPVLNPLSGMQPNQPPCHKTIVLNNLNICNPNNRSQIPMTQNEAELCQSLQSGTQCQNESKCRTVPPYLYKYYCGNQ